MKNLKSIMFTICLSMTVSAITTIMVNNIMNNRRYEVKKIDNRK